MIYPDVKALAKGKNFAAFTTMLPNGQPMTHVMWVDADDAHVLINTEIGRQKQVNVTKNPRVTVTVIDAANPYHYAEVRGTVVEQVKGPRARAHIDELSQKYTGQPYDPTAIKAERVLLVIDPERQRVNG
jgi:PPOX class probable F420-dependent enzyme